MTTLAGWCADADRALDVAAVARVLATGGTFAFGPDGVESFAVPKRLFKLHTRTSDRPAGSEQTGKLRM